MPKDAPVSPPRAETDRSADRVAALEETVEKLRARTEELRRERDQLLEENRALRQNVTHLRLLHDLEESIDDIEEKTGRLPAAPPPSDHLYTLLPSTFSFPVFFGIAESQGIDTDEARRCLLHFLAEELIVQEGSRLVKQEKPIEDATENVPG